MAERKPFKMKFGALTGVVAAPMPVQGPVSHIKREIDLTKYKKPNETGKPAGHDLGDNVLRFPG